MEQAQPLCAKLAHMNVAVWSWKETQRYAPCKFLLNPQFGWLQTFLVMSHGPHLKLHSRTTKHKWCTTNSRVGKLVGAPEPLVENHPGQPCGIHLCKYLNLLPCMELAAQSNILRTISPIGESVTFQNLRMFLNSMVWIPHHACYLSNFFGRSDVDMGPKILLPRLSTSYLDSEWLWV